MSLFVNRYLIDRVLGQGGMGRVYLASDKLMAGRRVALKEIRVDLLSRKLLASLAHEFSVLCRLHHPNLVEVYDFCLAPHCYFTMEYVDGCDLRSAGLDDDGLYNVVAQVCRALDYIHARGLVHLDVKPPNLLYSHGVVKLVDFGVAAFEQTAPVEGYTAGFVAPEVLEGHSFDGRADLFALGRTLLKLHEECHPSVARTEQPHERAPQSPRTLMTVREAETLPPLLRPIVERLVRVDPGERFGSAAEVIEALSAATGRSYPLATAATSSGIVQSPPLKRRKQELELLEQAWNGALGGKSRMLVVRGAAGLGKTRLCKQLRAQAQLDGGLVLEVAGARDEQASWAAASSLVEQLAAVRVQVDAATRAELARLCPALWPDEGPAPPLDSAAARSRLKEAVLSLLGRAAAEWAILLLIDDAQWLDDTSRQLFEELQGRVREQKSLLVVVLARDGWPDGEGISLDPIGVADARGLVDEVFGPGVLPESLVVEAVQKARGSIFYLCELLNLLADDGAVVRLGSGWQWCDRPVALPETAVELVSARIRLLPESQRRILRAGAVLGARFAPAIVEEVAGQSHADFTDLVGRRLLQGDGRSLRFASDEVHGAAVTDALSGRDWQGLHRQLAQAAVRHDAHPTEVARLFLGSDVPEAAIAFIVEAGRRAAALFDHAGAVRHHDQALLLLDHHQPPEGLDLEWQIHSLRLEAIRAGGLGQLDLDEERVLECARDLDREAEARVRLMRVGLQRGRFSEVQNQADRVLELGGEPALRAEALRLGGLARYNLGELPAAIARLDEAVAICRTMGDKSEAQALNDRGLVHGYAGAFAAAVADHAAALALLEDGGAADPLASTHNNLGFANWCLGHYAEALADLQAALRLRQAARDVWGEGVTRNNLGNVLRHLGDLDGAAAACEQAIALCRRSGNRLYQAIALNNLGQVEEERDRFEGAAALYQEALSLARSLGDRIREGDNLANLGICRLHAGDAEAARGWLRQSVAVRREIGDRAYLVLDLSYLARGELDGDARGHVEEALRILSAGQIGIEQVQAVHLNAHLVWTRLGEVGLATAALSQAARVVEERLAALDPPLRAGFIAGSRVNREIRARCHAP